MVLNDKVYSVLKWIVLIFLPALNTFLFALGSILEFDSNTVCGVISAVTVFLGALIGVSTHAYYKEKEEVEK